MALTPISHDLIHDVEAVNADKEILDRLCSVAAKQAAPLVRRALIRETAASGASAWIDDAKQMLRLLQEEEVVYRSGPMPLTEDEEAIKQHLAQSIEASGPLRPDEDEVWLHAAGLARGMMTNWVQVVRDRAAGWNPSRPLLPFNSMDTSPDWAALWEAVSLFVLDRGEVETILRSTCREILNEAKSANASEIAMPLGATLYPAMLEFSLEMTGPELIQRIQEHMQDIVSIAFIETPASKMREEPAIAGLHTFLRTGHAIIDKLRRKQEAPQPGITITTVSSNALANLLLPKEWQEAFEGHKLASGSKLSVDSNAWTAVFQGHLHSK